MSAAALNLIDSLHGHKGTVWSVAWSLRGLLASCGADRTVRVWHQPVTEEASTNTNPNKAKRPRKRWQCVASLADNTFRRTIRCVTWSPDGRSLAAACFDSTASVLELLGGERPKLEAAVSLEGHENEVKSVAFSSSGGLLASCSRDRSIWIWEVGLDFDYECIAVLNGHSADIKCVRWHPQIELLVSASYDNDIRVWVEDEDDWFCLETLCAHDSTVWSVAFNSDGRYLVSVGDRGTVVIWYRKDPPRKIVGDHPRYSVVAHLTDVHDGTIYSVDWQPELDRIATCGSDDAIRILQRASPESEKPYSLICSSNISVENVLPAGDKSKENSSVGVTDEPKDSQTPASSLRTETDEKWSVAAEFPRAHTGDVNCIAWCPTEKRILASCGDDGLVRIWEYVENQ